jgi:hypothetical protein
MTPRSLSPGTVPMRRRTAGAERSASARLSLVLTVFALLVAIAACTGSTAPVTEDPEARPPAADGADTDPPDGGQTFSLLDFGAACDGEQDDRAALKAALEAAGRAGGGTITVPAGICRILATERDPYAALGGNTVLAGGGSRASSLRFETDDPRGYRALLHTEGDDVAVRGLTLTSAEDVYGVFLQTTAGRNLTLQDVVMTGPGQANGTNTLHGLLLPANGTLENLRLSDVTVQGVEYGLLQQNESTATITGVTVEGATFRANRADDLAFNAPAGRMTDVVVRNSTFADGGYFAISLANVQDAVLEGNTISGYAHEFVHVEDRSARLRIAGNTFSGNRSTGEDWYSFVFVVSGSSDVDITGNTFRTSPTDTGFQCVFVGPGGPDSAPPRGVTVRDNTATLTGGADLVAVYGGAEVSVEES